MRSAFCYLFEVAGELKKDYADMVCEKHPEDAFIKRVVKALSENTGFPETPLLPFLKSALHFCQHTISKCTPNFRH